MLLAKHKMEAKVIFKMANHNPAEQAVIHVRTHGLYGTGCFEGICGYWNDEDQQLYLFRLREHYVRFLLNHAKYYKSHFLIQSSN